MKMAGHYLKLFEANMWWEVGGLEQVDAWHTLSAPLVGTHTVPVKEHTPYTVVEFIDPDWGDKVNSGIGLSYRPARLHGLAGRYDNPLPELNYPQVMDL
jgi:hypothetical protein